MHLGVQHPVTTGDRVLRQARAGDIQRNALAGNRFIGWPVLRMQSAHAQLDAGRRQHEAILDANASGDERAGDNETGTGQGECPIDCKAWIQIGVALARPEREQRRPQRLDPGIAHRRHRQQRCRGERGLG
jgi:hypothetical protein